MKKLLTLFFAAACTGVMAQPKNHFPIEVETQDAWVRATVAHQKATGAFLKIVSRQPARLVQATSTVSPVVEIHEMVKENDVMKMRAIAGLDLPAGKIVELKPGSYHIMLMDLPQPIPVGATIPITLVIETQDGQRHSTTIKATARSLIYQPNPVNNHALK